MFIRILPTTFLQIFCENLLYFQVIFKSMKIADDTFLGNSECEWVNLCMLTAAKSKPDNFHDILQEKAKSGIDLIEKCQSEHDLQLLFKYFVKSFSISK